MNSRFATRLWVPSLALGLLLASAAGAELDAARMSTKDLGEKLGKPDVVVLDVRSENDWKTASKKISGAVRQSPDKTEVWAASLPKDKTYVLYCS